MLISPQNNHERVLNGKPHAAKCALKVWFKECSEDVAFTSCTEQRLKGPSPEHPLHKAGTDRVGCSGPCPGAEVPHSPSGALAHLTTLVAALEQAQI